MKVLIVGAGPTGLTAAIELARRGIDTTIVDKRRAGSGFTGGGRDDTVTEAARGTHDPSGLVGAQAASFVHDLI